MKIEIELTKILKSIWRFIAVKFIINVLCDKGYLLFDILLVLLVVLNSFYYSLFLL